MRWWCIRLDFFYFVSSVFFHIALLVHPWFVNIFFYYYNDRVWLTSPIGYFCADGGLCVALLLFHNFILFPPVLGEFLCFYLNSARMVHKADILGFII